MSGEDAPETEAEDTPDDNLWSRTTAPQSPYTKRQVGIGLVVFAVLAFVAFALPLVVA